MLKICTSCKTEKRFEEFYNCKASKDGKLSHRRVCSKARAIQWEKDNRERVRIRKREWCKNHLPQLAKKQKHWTQECKANNPEQYAVKIKKQTLARCGITLEEYNALLAQQSGLCALCGQPPKVRILSVDHFHGCCPTRKTCHSCVRGLLCHFCNGRLLPVLERHPELQSLKVVQYLNGRPLKDLDMAA